ncbi:MAG: alpha/beta hydrolase [Saprospiraceae bacterium]|nr:alpha/beta hydrolase [Saprospiraceae bacterium]
MRIKKRYLGLGAIVIFLAMLQLEFFAFRESDTEQAKILKDKGVKNPAFYSYEFEGQQIHYTHVGNPEQPLLILVHGAPGSSSAMLPYLSDTLLGQSFQLIAVDRPGYGYSNYGVSEPSLEKQSKAMLELIKRHPNPATILLGHSYGGPVIVRMAIDAPELIQGLCIVAGSIDPKLEPQEWWRGPVNWPIIRSLLPGSLRVANQEIMVLYSELQEMMKYWDQVICQVLVFQGMEDKLVPKGNAAFAEKMLTNAASVDIRMIEGGNHFILWSMQAEIREGLINMLKTLN